MELITGDKQWRWVYIQITHIHTTLYLARICINWYWIKCLVWSSHESPPTLSGQQQKLLQLNSIYGDNSIKSIQLCTQDSAIALSAPSKNNSKILIMLKLVSNSKVTQQYHICNIFPHFLKFDRSQYYKYNTEFVSRSDHLLLC